ncbi:hypothetical protein M3223_17650 [Paenibacillus pasadenensis]|uniref:hypothetical protein n=1 Tax=Paenibacillus pasadenensis TaxID=217090 RepID=UPI00203AFEF0|nr:hypothetical protein [Paenibacillus pasadenensis]MCM3749186.1 hypothetical protein [Paenibacillus pasadenensis]
MAEGMQKVMMQGLQDRLTVLRLTEIAACRSSLRHLQCPLPAATPAVGPLPEAGC